jgi:crotonobetainyl-CoA:carnitine CoA-transferase CaiB-like acyl-CoA transferase
MNQKNLKFYSNSWETAEVGLGVTSPWDMSKINNHLRWQLRPGVHLRNTWACKDGFVRGIIRGWPRARDFQIPLIKWMASEGMADDFLMGFDWEKFDLAKTSQDVVDHIEGAIAKFFISHTKAELYEEAVKNQIWIYPVSTTKEVMESAQLAARKFWVDLQHPELDTSITYPGAFACSSEVPPKISRRAPLIGEHNEEIYEKELGVPKHELVILKQNGII